jgi:formylglycine-generating enzyme required for sulfatase activity
MRNDNDRIPEDSNQQPKGADKMKTARRMVTALALLAGMMWAASAQAGDLTPPGPPGATMHTLEEIYQELLSTKQQVGDLEARLNATGQYVSSGDMVLIPAGSFSMGDAFTEGGTDERPVHTVSVSAFYMDATEVTKAKWGEVYTWATGKGYAFDNAGSGKATNHPVHTVNWYDCVAWANARSQYDGFTPCYTNANGTAYTNSTVATEAEWEKAARGGASGRRFPWEDANTMQHARANYRAFSSYSYETSPTTDYHPSYATGGTPYTSPVGSFAPNGYGLYDMAGNLYEWCWDWYDSGYYATSPGADPRGPASGSKRVFRGGSWLIPADNCRVAYHDDFSPGNEGFYLGFRLVRAAQ